MNVRDLKIFVTACQEGDFSRAAVRLGLSQPALSRTVRVFESSAGIALFRRTGHGVELTEAGRVVQAHAERVLREMDALEASLASLRDDDLGEVTVLLPLYVGRLIVPPMVRQFALIHPRAAIHLFESMAADIPGRLLNGAADLGLCYNMTPSRAGGGEAIAMERMHLVGLPELVGSQPDPILIGDACKLPLVLPSRHTPFRNYVEQFAASAGHVLNVVRELEISQTMLAFVLEREGATILPFSHCSDEVRQGLVVARPIEPALRRHIVLAGRSQNMSRLARSATDLLRRVVAEQGPALRWTPLPGQM